MTTVQEKVEKLEEAAINNACSICCETFSARKRKSVPCFRCQKEACVQCVKAYLLSTFDDAHCMFCKIGWNREFIDEHLSQNFRMKQYKSHREDILCEREKARLHETHALYTTIQERLKLLNEEKRNIRKNMATMESEFKNYYKQYQEQIRLCNGQLANRERQTGRLFAVLRGDTDELPGDDTFSNEVIERTRSAPLPCPKTGCHSFLDSNNQCEVCKTKVCVKCRAIKTDALHQCKEEDVETVKQLKKDSKACPQCSVLIYKIDGCDQMWCTMCHTPFSWRTGEKITRGAIHNPHMYEWRRNNGGLARGALDNNGCPIINDVGDVSLNIKRITGGNLAGIVWSIHREMVEIEDLHLRQVQDKTDPTRDLRVAYLTGRMSEDAWKHELQKHEKRESKKFDERQVFQMYTETLRDLFRGMSQAESKDELIQLNAQMVSLMKYVRENLQKINTRYGSVATYQYANYDASLATIPDFAIQRHHAFAP